MKRILCIIFVCLLCFSSDFAQLNKVTDQILQVLDLMQKNQLDDAEKLLQKLKLTAPNNVDILNLLGIVFDQKGKPAEAEKQFRQALLVNPKAISPLANLGVLLAKTPRKSEAIKVFETVIRLSPNHPEATINLGFLYNTVGNYLQAVAYLKKANTLQPNTYDIIFNLGAALYHTKSYYEAFQILEISVNLSPQSAEPLYWLGMIAFSRNQASLAENYFQKALDLRPNYAEANFMLGELFAKNNQYLEAKKYYELVLKSDSTKPAYYIRLGGIHLFLKDFERAQQVFNQAAMSFPKIPEIHYFLAVTARSLGSFNLAIAEVKKSLSIKETADSDALFGAIMSDRNENVEAEKYLRKALLISPNHFNALNDLGRLLIKNRRFEEAIQILQRAVALSTNPDVHYQLFLAYSRLNRKADAAHELEIFKQLSKGNQ